MSKVNAVPFHEKSYWETRFDKEKHFEWLATWKNIKSEAEPYLDKSNAILHLGCGNSELAFDLSDDGYKQVVNLDYAKNVIDYMKQVTKQRLLLEGREKDYSELEWITGDCLNNLASYLPQPQYSVVIDKSLVDTIACGDDDQQTRVKKLSQEILSVTKPDGCWLSISFSNQRDYQPDDNSPYYWKTEKVIPIEADQSNDKPGAPTIYYYLHINRKTASS